MDVAARVRKKRIPKACGACRESKLRCDGKRPCTRCHSAKKVCAFVERPKDAQESKIQHLEDEIEALKDRLQSSRAPRPDTVDSNVFAPMGVENPSPLNEQREAWHSAGPVPVQFSAQSINLPQPDAHEWYPSNSSNKSPNESLPSIEKDAKGKRLVFLMRGVDPMPDFITAGLLNEDQATSYSATFFDGCHRYVPIFDPRHDTISEIRSRSSLLFCIICAVGYRTTKGTESHEWHRLDFHIKRMLTATITTTTEPTLETVQALLVRACYAPERSLLLAIATRMSLDLCLPEAYDQLIGRLISGRGNSERMESDEALMRKTRTWLHLLVLGNMLHVDAGNLPSFEFRGNVRRCRILLDSQLSTVLDLSLFSQVELNVLRADIYARLTTIGDCDDDEMMQVITDAKIDIDVWYNDWVRITEKFQPTEASWMRLNLQIQRYWSDCMALCRAVRISGVENVDAMSATQKHILLMAKGALMQHFLIIIEEPRVYLRHLRFAMDFVWAKCAFCFLLLLKLSVLLPDDPATSGRNLVADGEILVQELRAAAGGAEGQQSSNTSRIYLHLIQSGIQKYRRAIRIDSVNMGSNGMVGEDANMTSSGRGEELEAFVPDQFIFEWDFPGLTLFSSPMVETGWLDELLSASLGADDESFGFGWL
ncbi:hypothetical protein B0J13DRAFT_142879 [Dactylonectria estremocensis]|uniref:Zn(2)-C6 fungal-type domain-containing protein n=1 Tax=Dactylonectria estremocensis TaxID=1079267 RepID=A0A9P9DX69_9HYPO|nr:hypothetical protein B0J13DRAFT_142879 [Dactylonectria estremocensis]